MGGWVCEWVGGKDKQTDRWIITEQQEHATKEMKQHYKKYHCTSEVERSSILRVPPLGGLISRRCDDP